jgi:hypothetical protein
MAGDWMKIELDLPDKPEVHAIAGELKIDPDAVVGKLIRVWAWFDKQTSDGNARGVTFVTIDRFAFVTGFAKAMENVLWLKEENGILIMPKFDRHTSASAKTRATTGERVKRHRNAKGNGDVTAKSLPREEKNNRDSSNKPISSNSSKKPNPVNNSDAREGWFELFWKTYPRKVGKGAAERAWEKVSPNVYPAILKAIELQKRSEQWLRDGGQFIPHPSTWLNEKRWMDEGVTVEDGGLSAAGRQTAQAVQDFVGNDNGGR